MNPSASSHQTYVQISGKTFSVRVKFDLFLAHFAASHFGSARKLLNEVYLILKLNNNPLFRLHQILPLWKLMTIFLNHCLLLTQTNLKAIKLHWLNHQKGEISDER